MIKDFILPDIGEGVVECELVDWLVKEGDTVVEDQPIADVMTDKALVQIPAPFGGVVTKLYYAKGDIAKVHAPLYAVQFQEDEPAVIAPTPSVDAALAPTGAISRLSSIEEFLLPDIGEGIVECELVEWLVQEGDSVKEDQPIADVMTDKALVQIPAIKAGKIAKLHYRKGQLAKVHAPLYAIEIEQPSIAPETIMQPLAAHALSAGRGDGAAQRQGKALASPAVRRMARSLDIDLSRVQGSGKHGRVYKEDISRFQALGAEGAASQPDATLKAPLEPLGADSALIATVPHLGTHGSTHIANSSANHAVNISVDPRDSVEPIRGVKAVMARMMTESVSTIPHFTYCEEFDLTELVALRESMKVKYSSAEVKLTMMPFFMKAMSLALSQFPIMNSQVNADCTELTYKARHNIGMAVDAKVGLLVPNVKDVQNKSILEIAQEISRLTQAARSGRVAPADLKDGTISISNIGALGGTVATPIINKPEVAIVALGKLQTLPRFNAKGEVEARQIMQVSWSGDHRVIDGGTIARFCNLWKQYLEAPQEMLLAMR